MLFTLKIAAFLIGHLPLGVAIALGKALGRAAYRFDKSHRKRVFENLETAYGGGLSDKEKSEIAKKVFINLSITAVEFMRIPWLRKEDLNGYVECEGIENFEKALQEKKGIILLTAHFGNWELMGAYFGLAGYPLDVVVRELDNPKLEEFIRWVRTRGGNKIVYKHRAMRRLLKRLSENAIAGILLDQNVARNEGVFVDFFGAPACTNKGAALIAAASGAAVVPAFIVRTGKSHRVIIGKKVGMSFTGNREEDALENTARCTKAIEDVIRLHPEQWFWVHRRWKTRPVEGD